MSHHHHCMQGAVEGRHQSVFLWNQTEVLNSTSLPCRSRPGPNPGCSGSQHKRCQFAAELWSCSSKNV